MELSIDHRTASWSRIGILHWFVTKFSTCIYCAGYPCRFMFKETGLRLLMEVSPHRPAWSLFSLCDKASIFDYIPPELSQPQSRFEWGLYGGERCMMSWGNILMPVMVMGENKIFMPLFGIFKELFADNFAWSGSSWGLECSGVSFHETPSVFSLQFSMRTSAAWLLKTKAAIRFSVVPHHKGSVEKGCREILNSQTFYIDNCNLFTDPLQHFGAVDADWFNMRSGLGIQALFSFCIHGATWYSV